MVLIIEDHEECKACVGTGLTPCNGTDTGWCLCSFCGGSKTYVRRVVPRYPYQDEREREARYMEAWGARLAWEAAEKVKGRG
jgi:hypothetical protein